MFIHKIEGHHIGLGHYEVTLTLRLDAESIAEAISEIERKLTHVPVEVKRRWR